MQHPVHPKGVGCAILCIVALRFHLTGNKRAQPTQDKQPTSDNSTRRHSWHFRWILLLLLSHQFLQLTADRGKRQKFDKLIYGQLASYVRCKIESTVPATAKVCQKSLPGWKLFCRGAVGLTFSPGVKCCRVARLNQEKGDEEAISCIKSITRHSSKPTKTHPGKYN